MHYIELDQFIGRRYLVTVHGPINPAVGPAVALRQTSAVLARIKAERLKPVTGFELSYAIVSALTRDQEDFVEVVTKVSGGSNSRSPAANSAIRRSLSMSCFRPGMAC